jgi:chromosome partitioning protein
MPIIAVVNQKGGTGKTIVATNLATLFAGQQGEVLLVDADPQQSALKWQRDRPAHLPQVSVIGLPAPNLHREILRLQTKYGVILIDGGGRVTATARATVAVADFLLVPTLASLPDARSTQRFFAEVVEEVAAIKGRVSGAILLASSTYRRAYTASARCGILIPQPWLLGRGTPSPQTNRAS